MSNRDPINVYQQPDSVRCPVCLRVNPANARLCMECGEPLVEAHIAPGTVYGPTIAEKKLLRDPRWLRGYAVLTWVIGAALAVIALGIGIIAEVTRNESRAVYALVAGTALLMSNILMGHGLWNFKKWGLRGALSVHGTLLVYLIFQLVRRFWNPNIPYLDDVMRPAVGLCIVGIALLWIGLTDRGLRVDGRPDPEQYQRMLLRTEGPDRSILPQAQRVRDVPYQPETPNYYLNRHPERDAPPWGNLPGWAMMLGAYFLTRLGEDEKKAHRRGKKVGLKEFIDVMMKRH